MPALERDVWAGSGHLVQLNVNQPTNLSIKSPNVVSKYGWLPSASVPPPAMAATTKGNSIFKEFAPKIPTMGKVKYHAASFRADGGPPMPHSKNPFFIRNRPHPNKVRHIKGLNDVPICTVFNAKYCEGAKQPEQPSQSTQLTGLQMSSILPKKVLVEIPLGNLPRTEKAIPGIGMIQMHPTWLSKLRQLTQDAGLQTQKTMPMFRTRSADDVTMRPATNSRASRASQRKAENDFVRRTVSQGGDRPSLSASAPERPTNSQDGVRFASNSQDGVRLPDIHVADGGLQERRIPIDNKPNMPMSFPDGETFVFHVLGSLLETEDISAIQQWLATSPEQEKERVLEIIRRLADNDAEYREGVEHVIAGDHHGAMLQHPDSIDKNAINSFNSERRQKLEEERRKEQDTIRLYSPPLLKSLDQNIDRDIEKGSRQSERAREEATDVLCNLLNKSTSNEDQEIEEIRTKLASRSSSRGLLGKPQKQREVRINSRIDE